MSVVDPDNPALFSEGDFITQIVAEINAIKQRILERVEALQTEDGDIRLDFAAADSALNSALSTAIGLRLVVPTAGLTMPALVANAALVTNSTGTTLTWDADYGAFVANAAALTEAVADATAAAAAATAAAEAAQEAVDTGAVSKGSTADQVMVGKLITRNNVGAHIASQRLDDSSKFVQIRAPSGTQGIIEYGSGYSSLLINGNISMANLGVQSLQAIAIVLPAGATQTVASGAVLDVAAGGTLTLTSLPVNPTDAVNKQYVDGARATALVLPGNAVNPLEAVPLQQIGDRLRFDFRSQTTLSGTSVVWSSIPSWAKRITVNLDGVKFVSGGASPLMALRLGDSSGFYTSGYHTNQIRITSAPATIVAMGATAAFASALQYRLYKASGHFILTKSHGNAWNCEAQIHPMNAAQSSGAVEMLTGSIILSDVLTSLKLAPLTEDTTFEAGSVSLLIEG
jgi:hypothetical protein